MKMYKVWFSHSKTSNHCYHHIYTDWTLVESESVSDATKDAREWVRENRCNNGCRNRVKILEVREVK